jgi:hypothetical protein
MGESMYYDAFKLWKVDILRKYCRKRGIGSTNKRKDEWIGLAYAAYSQNYTVVIRMKADASRQYTTRIYWIYKMER